MKDKGIVVKASLKSIVIGLTVIIAGVALLCCFADDVPRSLFALLLILMGMFGVGAGMLVEKLEKDLTKRPGTKE